MPAFAGPPREVPPGQQHASPEMHEAVLADLFARRPDRSGGADTWIFTYGSLIWNPCFAHTGERLARAPGWHRAFCLGWMQTWRGSPIYPGLMMALDRGGSCTGVAFRLPQDAVAENLRATLRREMPFANPAMRAHWMKLSTGEGPIDAVGFVMQRSSPAYVAGLTEAEIVASLATSSGEAGSMAEYLANTVAHLEERGIHDRYLWHMQAEVARVLGGAGCGLGP